jgi:hypothetical protein
MPKWVDVEPIVLESGAIQRGYRIAIEDPAPPPATPLRQSEILKKFHWNAEQLRLARESYRFPPGRPAKSGGIRMWNWTTPVQPTELVWDREAVDRWEADLRDQIGFVPLR